MLDDPNGLARRKLGRPQRRSEPQTTRQILRSNFAGTTSGPSRRRKGQSTRRPQATPQFAVPRLAPGFAVASPRSLPLPLTCPLRAVDARDRVLRRQCLYLPEYSAPAFHVNFQKNG